MDKSPLGQKPTGQYPTGQKPTAKFGRVDKSPLLKNRLKSVLQLLTLIRQLLQGKSQLQCVFTDIIISRVCCNKQLNLGVKSHLNMVKIILRVWVKQSIIIGIIQITFLSGSNN